MNKWQFYIKYNVVEGYQEVLDFLPFSMSLNLVGKVLSKSVEKITVFNNGKTKRTIVLDLWKLKDSTTELFGMVKQNGTVVYEAQISLLNSKFDLFNGTCEILFLKEETDYVQMLKDNDQDIEIAGDINGGFWWFWDYYKRERLWSVAEDLSDYNFLQEAGSSFPPAWDSGTEYIKAEKLYVGGIEQSSDLYDERSVVSIGLNKYRAIQDNINKNPATEPTYWLDVTTDVFNGWVRTILFVDSNLTFGPDSDPQYITPLDSVSIKYNLNLSRVVYTYNTYYTSNKDYIEHFIYGGSISYIISQLVESCFPGVLFSDSFEENHYCTWFNDRDLRPGSIIVSWGIFLLSDIKRADTNSSGIENPGNILASRILEIFKLVWNFDWIINENGYFQLKHPSEISGIEDTIDLRTTTENKQIYQNDPKNLMAGEVWKYQETNDTEFNKGEILYNSIGDKIDYDLSEINNSALWAVGNPDAPDDGFAILVTDISAPPETNNWSLYQQNEEMKPNALLLSNMLYERPAKVGTIDGVSYELDNERQIDLGKIKGEIGILNDISFNTGFRTVLTDKLKDVAYFKSLKISTDDDNAEIEINI